MRFIFFSTAARFSGAHPAAPAVLTDGTWLSSGICSVVAVGFSAFEMPSEVMVTSHDSGNRSATIGQLGCGERVRDRRETAWPDPPDPVYIYMPCSKSRPMQVAFTSLGDFLGSPWAHPRFAPTLHPHCYRYARRVVRLCRFRSMADLARGQGVCAGWRGLAR